MAWSEIGPRVLRLPRGRRTGADALARRLRVIAASALLAAFFAAGWTASAAASDTWRVAREESRLSFGYTEDGAPATGAFGRFSGVGAFDQGAPETARLTFEIAVGSIRLKDDFRTEFVRTEAWFNTEDHPTATYELVSLAPLGGGRYRAIGRLTIKGVTREIESELRLEIDGDTARASGRVAFDRLRFRLGDTLSLFVDIGRKVEAAFDLVARRTR